ncbi:unnamed protein product [Ilex paraguariensis]|uniref:Uncharacterized protein n=1 Tax=Ilex paraguariensis TaxID=185542 RepID=A0ABC8TIX6_9AQUA
MQVQVAVVDGSCNPQHHRENFGSSKRDKAMMVEFKGQEDTSIIFFEHIVEYRRHISIVGATPLEGVFPPFDPISDSKSVDLFELEASPHQHESPLAAESINSSPLLIGQDDHSLSVVPWEPSKFEGSYGSFSFRGLWGQKQLLLLWASSLLIANYSIREWRNSLAMHHHWLKLTHASAMTTFLIEFGYSGRRACSWSGVVSTSQVAGRVLPLGRMQKWHFPTILLLSMIIITKPEDRCHMKNYVTGHMSTANRMNLYGAL